VPTVLSQVPELSENQVLVEPAGRDTAPCLALAAAAISARDADATLIALPSDHYIYDELAYCDVLARMARIASSSPYVVTIGISPDRPETGYGYIRRGEPLLLDEMGASVAGASLWEVGRFIEKPALDVAQNMMKEGGWYWNSGVFAFSASGFLQLFAELIPQDVPHLEALLDIMKSHRPALPPVAYYRDVFSKLSRVSVDHAIMEKAPLMAMLSAAFGWDDLGSWAAVARVYSRDEDNNVVVGDKPCLLDTSNSLFFCSPQSKRVVSFGLNDIVFVDTGDVLLLTSMVHSLKMKQLLQSLRGTEDEPLLDATASRAAPSDGASVEIEGNTLLPNLEGEFVSKPWGYEIWWAHTDKYVGKVLSVRQGQALSLQYHERKMETMLCLSGKGTLLVDGKAVSLGPGMSATIAPKTVHRLEAESDLTVLEISTPEVDDVVRVDDRYGRRGLDKRHRDLTTRLW
jgi:mannose-1-phosphate guanylyltransferase